MSDRDGGTRKWPELPPPGSEFPRSFCVSTSRVVQTRKMAVSILSDGVDSQQPQIILCHRWEAHWNFWHQYYNIIINFILYLSLLICYQHFFQETFRHDIIQESITAGWNQRKHCWNLATLPQPINPPPPGVFRVKNNCTYGSFFSDYQQLYGNSKRNYEVFNFYNR